MTAHNVLHSWPVRQCAIKIAAPAFEPRPEAAGADLVEKREPRGASKLKKETEAG